MRASERLQERFLYRIIMQFRNFYVSSNRDCSEQNFPCFSSVFFKLSGKGESSKKRRNIPDWSDVAITLAGLWTKRHFARRSNVYVQVIKWLVPSARSTCTCTCNIMVGSIGSTSFAQQTRHNAKRNANRSLSNNALGQRCQR